VYLWALLHKMKVAAVAPTGIAAANIEVEAMACSFTCVAPAFLCVHIVPFCAPGHRYTCNNDTSPFRLRRGLYDEARQHCLHGFHSFFGPDGSPLYS